MILKIKYLDSFYYRSNSLKGAIRTVTNYRDLLSLSPEQFYKIEFFQFRTPQIFTILKEGDGDISKIGKMGIF